jgi:hypothetical protein
VGLIFVSFVYPSAAFKGYGAYLKRFLVNSIFGC